MLISNIFISLPLILGSSSLIASYAKAQDLGIQTTARVGYGNLSLAGSASAGLSYRVEINGAFYSKWSAGLGITQLTSATTITPLPPFSSFRLDNSHTLIDIHLNDHFLKNLHPLYLGLLTGIGHSSLTSSTYLLVGVQCGYDWIIANHLSFGPLAQMIALIATNNTLILQGLAGLTYSF